MDSTRDAKRRKRERLKRKHWGPDGFTDWSARQPCLICAYTPSDPHHVRTRGAGGSWHDVVPLCRVCHGELHSCGTQTFEARYSTSLRECADLHHEAWLKFRQG